MSSPGSRDDRPRTPDPDTGLSAARHVRYGIHLFRPADSDIENVNVHAFRKETEKSSGRKPVDADIVVGSRQQPRAASLRQSQRASNEMGLIKNKYIGRTFIQPSQEMRDKVCDEAFAGSEHRLRLNRAGVFDRAGYHLLRIVDAGRLAPGGALGIASPMIKNFVSTGWICLYTRNCCAFL